MDSRLRSLNQGRVFTQKDSNGDSRCAPSVVRMAVRWSLLTLGAVCLLPASVLGAALDSDGDGIFDALEIGPDAEHPLDTDGDGLPNYLDSDSDNDGIPDKEELESIYLPDSLCWDHNGDDGTTFDARIGADIFSDVANVSPIVFGSGLQVPTSHFEFVLSAADTANHAQAILNEDYAELQFDLLTEATLDAVSHGLAPASWGATAAGDYQLAVELSTDGFQQSSLVYDDGYMPSPDDEYAYVYRPVLRELRAGERYTVRLYVFNEQNQFSTEDTITLDDVCLYLTVVQRRVVDSDTDTLPDYLDLDSDNDGIDDAVEVGDDSTQPVDTDGDGIPDFRDLDSDGDGLADAVERGSAESGPRDTDSDGVPDYRDTDSDDDGINDRLEVGVDFSNPIDSDGDGIPDYLVNPDLLDSDNDGILDVREIDLARNDGDSDGDGLPDHQDRDSDGDGVSDAHERNAIGGDPRDSDYDGVVDYLDLDSDNDGLTDAFEVTGSDTDGDGRVDAAADNDFDGIDDMLAASERALPDSDGDGFADHLDRDSDNDGLSDGFESTGGMLPGGNADLLGSAPDNNADGLSDVADVNRFLDTDDDGLPNRLDSDSDGDGVSDLVEAGGSDIDGDGVQDAWLDSDRDGIADAYDVDVVGGSDLDNDGIADAVDADYINHRDTDGDGIVDSFDEDPFGLGYVPHRIAGEVVSVDTIPDVDGDGLPDYLDGASAAERAGAPGNIKTGVDGYNGCSLGGDRAGLFDPVYWVLSVFSLLGLSRRRRHVPG